MIITDLYQTKIECNKYNANIDDDTVTVTVTLKDFNNNNVVGKSVTLYCSKGFFTKCIGATKQVIDNVVTKNVTGITNNNGQITATWTASEWGLCTFTTNNSNIQINVTGYRTINLRNDGWVLKYSDHMASLEVEFTWNSTIPDGWSTKPLTLVNQIPVECRPTKKVIFPTQMPRNMFIEVDSSGDIFYGNVSGGNLSKPTVNATGTWMIGD